MRHFLKPWLPVILWMGFIFAMSTGLGGAEHTSRIIEPLLRWLFPHLAPENIALLHAGIRKAAHFTEYAVLGWLLWRALRQTWMSGSGGTIRVAGAALLIAVTYAATDELHQRFVSGRTPSLTDMLVDASGAFVALVVVATWNKRRSQ